MPRTQRIALLIGSPFGGLTGVNHDIDSIDARLRARGFTCRRCVGEDATRAQILGQLTQLRDDAGPQDAIVVYYSGHGGRAHLRDGDGNDSVAPHNFLVPIDYAIPVDHERSDDQPNRAERCRGVADFELAVLLFDLSERTRNVTVILDCCHSSTMVRGDERDRLFAQVPAGAPRERVRQLGGARLYRMPADMAERWAEYQRRADELPVDSNPHIVRIVATAAGSSAYEAQLGDSYCGYLTQQLCAALDDTEHAAVGWDVLVRRVRERIFTLRRSTTQRPELEGPRNRLPFSLQEDAEVLDRSTLTYRSDGTCFVRMGRIHGLDPHDRIDVLDEVGAVVARADVAELFDDSARVVLRTAGDAGGPGPANGSTVSVSSYERRMSVWIDDGVPHLQRLRAEVAAQMRLRLVDADFDPAKADFRIRGDAGQLHVEGPPGFRRVPSAAQLDRAIRLVGDLDDVARGMILQQRLGTWPTPVSVRWSVDMIVSRAGRPDRAWVSEDEPLPLDTRLHFEVRHADRGSSPLYVHVLDRGVSGRLSSLNPSQPAGVQVRAPEGKGSTVVRVPGLGARIKLFWPADVPRDTPRSEEFIVVASMRPVDLRDLMMIDPGIRARTRQGRARDAAIEVDVVAQTHPDHQLGQPLPLGIHRFRFDLRP